MYNSQIIESLKLNELGSSQPVQGHHEVSHNGERGKIVYNVWRVK